MSNSDARYFKGLIEPHLDALFRAAFRLARNRADAEDLVQEACIRAYQRIPEFDESRHVKAWLLHVLHNVFIDGARRARRSPVMSLGNGTDPVRSSPCTDPGPEESACTSQREEQLQCAWSKLEPGQRSLLALRAEGYRLSEIAEITGLAIAVLNARLYRARQSFARYLKAEQANEPENRREIAK
ncbi:MAG: sigma-70 family RNA polymerase sigma factor [Woeseia sp.]